MQSLDANLLGIGVLGFLGVVLIAWVAIMLRRMPFTLFQSILFGINYLLVRVLWRAEVQGALSIPPSQGAVIICNHRAPIDPFFLYLATHRMIHWMVAKEYVEHRAMSWFFRRVGTISVNRGGIDTAATKMAIRCTQQGGLVGLFPEGRINTTDKLLLPGRPGAAMIALRTRVPVIPCYVSGSPNPGTSLGPLITAAKVQLVIGEPIDLSPYYGREDDREVLVELTKRFLREIARLAGQPDFEPQLAGRFYRPGRTSD